MSPSSRLRSHKGNLPTLPQTKSCTICPAKFTRTTHLNRHMRSHTNERCYGCSMCGAEFTRSDLLARHRRTCGESIYGHKSRRRSCEACAESKIRCDLQFPCTKCVSRGRECVFINDPEVSRQKLYGSQLHSPSLDQPLIPHTSSSTTSFPSSVFPSPYGEVDFFPLSGNESWIQNILPELTPTDSEPEYAFCDFRTFFEQCIPASVSSGSYDLYSEGSSTAFLDQATEFMVGQSQSSTSVPIDLSWILGNPALSHGQASAEHPFECAEAAALAQFIAPSSSLFPHPSIAYSAPQTYLVDALQDGSHQISPSFIPYSHSETLVSYQF